jgi:hypothetical protein
MVLMRDGAIVDDIKVGAKNGPAAVKSAMEKAGLL